MFVNSYNIFNHVTIRFILFLYKVIYANFTYSKRVILEYFPNFRVRKSK